MNGITNKNQLTVVEEKEFDKPLFHKIDSTIDSCFRDCHNNYFHKFKYDCIYDNNLTNVTSNEIFSSTMAD